MKVAWVWLVAMLWTTSWAMASEDSERVAFFSEQIAPLLQRRCLSCHHDGDAKGGFSLSNSAGLADAGYVDADDVDASFLLEQVTPQNGKAAMPMDAEPLLAEEIAALRNWIDDGAHWPDNITLEPLVVTDRDWWSLRPIADGAGERVDQEANHPVDVFVNAKLEEHRLKPVEVADARTLIRRLTYDLTGLPPTPAEVDEFVKASEIQSDEAWIALVDRLLESPAFGEKWGQHWLDVARYAETHGYDKDKPRENAWPYRDYVIRSFNDDKPYSRFVQEQVAGDALFPDEPEGVLGLGFLAAGPWDFISHWEVGEGKLDGRIAKHLDRDEMISAVFNIFMSTTVQCAQCHHHKFDPIRSEDYYRLHAVFAAVDRADRVYAGLPAEQQQRQHAILATINDLTSEQDALTTKLQSEVAAKAIDIDRRIAELTIKYGNGTEPKSQYGYHSEITSDRNEKKWVQLDLGQSQDCEVVRIHPAYDKFNNIGAGFGFPLRYRVTVADDADFQKATRLIHDASDQDQPNPGTQTIVIDTNGLPFRYLRVTATKLSERQNDFIFALGEIEVFRKDGHENISRDAIVTAKDSIESGDRWGKANLVDGVFYRELTNEDAMAELIELRARRAAIVNAVRSVSTDQRLAEIKRQRDELNKELQSIPTGQMVYAAATRFTRGGQFTATEGKPRPIHALLRGDLRSPAERMTPGSLPLWEDARSERQAIDTASGFDWDEALARADLARYLIREDNPLVWRSIVNRLWLWTFGSPLVGTPNDFGRGGMQPTHPELLDYLAARLRDDPRQSLKSMVRLLVTSQAYRRSSRHDPNMAKLDSGNTYLWRAARRRLTAEEFRDSMLAVSGVLQHTMGGASFHDFVIEKPEHSPHYEYQLHDPADLKSHRRSVYRLVVRSQPQPLLTTLDCADPSISTPQRDESTTALQALAAWNNRLVEFAASKLGTRIDTECKSPEEQIRLACRLVLGREASPLEDTVLKQHLSDHGPASLARVLFNMNAFMYLD